MFNKLWAIKALEIHAVGKDGIWDYLNCFINKNVGEQWGNIKAGH